MVGENCILCVDEAEFGREEAPEFSFGQRIWDLADNVPLRRPEHGNVEGYVREAKPAGETLTNRRLV